MTAGVDSLERGLVGGSPERQRLLGLRGGGQIEAEKGNRNREHVMAARAGSTAPLTA